MKRMLSVLLLLIFIMGCSHVAPPREIIRRGSGPYPEQYVEIITHYLNSQLYAPDTLNLTVSSPPREITLDTDYPFVPLFKGHQVWECWIVYDAKGKNGKSVGNSFHVAWIRHNRLVAFDYRDIELEYGVKQRLSGAALPGHPPGGKS